MSSPGYASFSDEQLAMCLLNLAEVNEKLHGAAEMEATTAVLIEAAKRLALSHQSDGPGAQGCPQCGWDEDCVCDKPAARSDGINEL